MKKVTQRQMKKKQKGFTLIELGAGLLIVAIAAAAVGPIIYKKVKATEADSAAKTTQGYFNDMHAKWRKGPFTGLNNAWIIAAKVPDTGAISGTNILNYWGNTLTFAAGTLTGGVASGARQITDPVDPEACLDYVNRMSPFVDELIVGTTTVKPVGGALNESTAATSCNVSTNTVNVIMRKA